MRWRRDWGWQELLAHRFFGYWRLDRFRRFLLGRRRRRRSASLDRSRFRPAAGFLSVDEVSLQSRLPLLFHDWSFEFSVNHFAAVTVDHFGKPIPCERSFSGRVSVGISQPRPGNILGNTAKIIPDDCLSVFGALISRRAGAVRQQDKKNTANKKAPDAHVGRQFEPAPFNAFRKYSIVFLMPSSN